MGDFKIMTVWDLMTFLKQKVKENINYINQNVAAIKQVKANSKHSVDQLNVLSTLTKKNSELTSENNKFLSLFNELLKFQNEYSISKMSRSNEQEEIYFVEEDESSQLSREEVLEKTFSEEIVLNSTHPYFKDKDFLSELLQICMNEEQYERCSEISKIINTI